MLAQVHLIFLTLKCDYVTIVNIVLAKYLMGSDWLLRTLNS